MTDTNKELNDLFNTMNMNKNNNDDDDNDENNINIPQNKSQHIELDYYKILGVNNDASHHDIKKRYRHLTAKYHPDKYKDASEKTKQNNQEMYKLIRMAGEVLTVSEKRKYYDTERRITKMHDHDSHKNNFMEFSKLQEATITDDSKKLSKLEFKKASEDLNKKHGFDPNANTVIKEEDAKILVENLKEQRKIEELELEKKNLFAGSTFSSTKFNELFDKHKKKQERKLKQLTESGQIVKYDEGFTAFNTDGYSNFVTMNDNYDEIFGSNNTVGTSTYSSIKQAVELSKVDINDDDDDNLDNISSDEEHGNYYNQHNKNKIKQSNMNDFLKQRESEVNAIKDNYDNVRDTKLLLEDQFSISKGTTGLIGKEKVISKTKQIDSNLLKTYNRLLKNEKL